MGHAIFAYLRASSSPMCGTELCRRAVRDAERPMLNLEPDKLKALAWPGCQGNPRHGARADSRLLQICFCCAKLLGEGKAFHGLSKSGNQDAGGRTG